MAANRCTDDARALKFGRDRPSSWLWVVRCSSTTAPSTAESRAVSSCSRTARPSFSAGAHGEKALYRCEIDSLPRYYDGRAIGGVTFSLKYRDYHVRVARCLTRDLWLRFPMLATLEYLVVLLNGWPSLAIHQQHRLRAA